MEHTDYLLERQTLADLCLRLYESRILAGSEGNVSLRTADGHIVLTPSSRHKGSLRAEDMLVTDGLGNLVRGSSRVTKEFALHRMIYEARPDVGCIVHAHPVYGCVYAILGKPVPENYLLQMKLMVGPTAVAGYAPAGSRELVEQAAPFAAGHDTIILRNHGLLFCGKDAQDALCRCETAENVAHSCILADLMGGVTPMPE